MGGTSRSANSSLLTLSSSLGFEPGLLLGASGTPSLAIAT